MRDEIKKSIEDGTFAEKVVAFAQSFRTMLVPRSEVLVDTVRTLYPLVALSDKVLPLKSYLNLVRQIQRTTSLSKALAAELTKDLPESTSAECEAKARQASEFERELRAKGMPYIATMLDERGLLRQFERDAQRNLCTEDVFMVSCAYLEVEIAKQSSVAYLKGESPDFRETKKHRNPLDLSDEVVLKAVSAGLARPDEERGDVERGQIDSGLNHLVRLNTLHLTMFELVRWMKEGEERNIPRRKIDARKHFRLSHTDYERLMSMARRSGIMSFRNRKRDPANSYVLKAANHERVVQYAQRFGHTPVKTLNIILDDFFRLIEKRDARAKAEAEASDHEEEK